MEHKLKIMSKYYEAILLGKKTFEVRKDDRPYSEGDTLLLQETVTSDGCGYTGREMTVDVTYILRDSDYVKDGYCIMGIKIISTNKARYYGNKPSRAADVQPVDRWISVDEALPPDNKACVVMTKNNGLGVSRLMGRNRVEWTLFGEPVLYWLPIPEPPETTKG